MLGEETDWRPAEPVAVDSRSAASGSVSAPHLFGIVGFIVSKYSASLVAMDAMTARAPDGAANSSLAACIVLDRLDVGPSHSVAR